MIGFNLVKVFLLFASIFGQKQVGTRHVFLKGTVRQCIRQYMAVTSVVEFWSNSDDTIQSSGGEGGG
jgi:hypothetical protein